MTKKELVLAEIEELDEEELDELYMLILNIIQSKQQPKRPGLLSRLKQIQIDVPEDMAENHDLYINGEKSAKTYLH